MKISHTIPLFQFPFPLLHAKFDAYSPFVQFEVEHVDVPPEYATAIDIVVLLVVGKAEEKANKKKKESIFVRPKASIVFSLYGDVK